MKHVKTLIVLVTIGSLMLAAPGEAAAPTLKTRVAKLERTVKTQAKTIKTLRATVTKVKREQAAQADDVTALVQETQDKQAFADNGIVSGLRAERNAALDELRASIRSLQAEVAANAGTIASLTARAEAAESKLACFTGVVAVNADDSGLTLAGVHGGAPWTHPLLPPSDFQLAGVGAC